MKDNNLYFKIPVKRKEDIDPTSYFIRVLDEQDGVSALFAKKRGVVESSVYTYKFDKAKFKEMRECREWLRKHGGHVDEVLLPKIKKFIEEQKKKEN